MKLGILLLIKSITSFKYIVSEFRKLGIWTDLSLFHITYLNISFEVNSTHSFIQRAKISGLKGTVLFIYIKIIRKLGLKNKKKILLLAIIL